MYIENIGCERNKYNRSDSSYNQNKYINSQVRLDNDFCSSDHETQNSKNSCFPSLAMAYVEFQTWQNIYEPEVGFKSGTIFAELDKPWCVPAFTAGLCKRNGGCR